MVIVNRMGELAIDRNKTALVVIDLQKGIATSPTKPYPAHDVIKNAQKLVNAFRSNRCRYSSCMWI